MISVSVSETNLWPLAMSACLRVEIVFDDAVVDDDEGAGAVAVGVGVLFGGAAVGGPAGVADAEGAVDGASGDDGLEVAQLAGSAAELQAAGAVARGATGDGDAGGVVAAVFQAAQAFDDDGDDRLRADVSNDSAHIKSLDGDGADKLAATRKMENRSTQPRVFWTQNISIQGLSGYWPALK